MGKDSIHRPDEAAMLRILERNKNTMTEIVVRLAWKLGLSREEIRRLTWNDISFSGGQVILPDRTIPMDPETRACLRLRYDIRGQVCGFVVISDRRRGQMLPESISRLARIALDSEGQQAVRLADLRHDFIIRQLESHDWPYVARISGIAVPTLYARFSAYLPEKKAAGPEARRELRQVDEFQMWKVLQAEGASPVGLALWLTWKLGLQVWEAVSLTWEQVDFEKGVLRLADREADLGTTVQRLLREVLESRGPGADPHVLLTPRSQRPIDQPRLSKMVRTALIRGGMEQLTLRDLCREEKREGEDALILQYALEKGTVSRSEVMSLLGLSKVPSYERLRRLTEQRKLVRVGSKYYLTGTVVPPEEQYEVIRAHLERVDAAYRQELAELLHVGPRQCTLILKHLVEAGKLVQTGQRYRLAAPEAVSHMV